jgi:hypothetical protein
MNGETRWANRMPAISERAPLVPRSDFREALASVWDTPRDGPITLRDVYDKLAEGPLDTRRGRTAVIDEQPHAGESAAQQNARAARNNLRLAMWNNLTAAEKTQIQAWIVFANDFAAGVPRFRVGFPEHPEIELAAHDELHAISTYNLFCGITFANVDCRHTVTRLAAEEEPV